MGDGNKRVINIYIYSKAYKLTQHIDSRASSKHRQLYQDTVSFRFEIYMLAIYNGFRCMSSKIFVGGLSYGVDDQTLRESFATFGDVMEARIINDREAGRSRGFGFVTFASE